MQIFFTSDTHFYHKNVIEYCNRPWASVEEMNEGLIERWNAKVTQEDIVFHLGDVAFCGTDRLKPIMDRLNGTEILVKGNHDRSDTAMLASGFSYVMKSLDLLLPLEFDESKFGTAIYLHHQPILDFAETSSYQNCRYHFCGHVHNKWKRQGNIINVGVDVWNYEPVTLEEIFNEL